MTSSRKQSHEENKPITDFEDLLKTVFEENWRHARHVENERMWFTNIFALVIATTVSILATIEVDAKNITTIALIMLIISFLTLFSLIGSFVVLKLNLEFHNHKEQGYKIAKEMGLESFMAKTLGTDAKKSSRKITTVATLFLTFYSLTTSGLILGLLFLTGELSKVWLIISPFIDFGYFLFLSFIFIGSGYFLFLSFIQNKNMNEINAKIKGKYAGFLLVRGDERVFKELENALEDYKEDHSLKCKFLESLSSSLEDSHPSPEFLKKAKGVISEKIDKEWDGFDIWKNYKLCKKLMRN